MQDYKLVIVPTFLLVCVRGPEVFPHRQQHQFAEESVVFTLEEGVGTARLGYSYPGQPGFLGMGKGRHYSITQGGWRVTEYY